MQPLAFLSSLIVIHTHTHRWKYIKDFSGLFISSLGVAPLQVSLIYNFKVYEDIADHFSGTRYKPWPRVVEFVMEQPPFSLLADVGCGNGKCLGANKELFEVVLTVLVVEV